MKQLIRAIRRTPKRSGLVAALLLAVALPAMLFAWGPSRATFTMKNPASYVTFNSITDNPVHGDERNFVQIRDYTDNGAFGENVNLVPGKEYEVYVFYHNNASTNLNNAAHNYKGIALNSYMRVQMPATVNAGANARVTGFVGASNANPATVWDEAYGKNTSSAAVALRYVPNSAVITNNGSLNGKSVDLNKLASSNGAPLGYNAFDGKVPGCTEYSGFVTYRFKVDQPNFEVTKQVSPAGQNQYGETVNVAPGSSIDYKIKYKNTGTIAQDHVTLKDMLPAGVSFKSGTTMYSSSKTNNQWTATQSNSLTTSGIDFGSFAPGAALYVKFTATVAKNDDLEKCGLNTLINKVSANTQNGSKSDTATVTTTKECQEEKTVKVCDEKTGEIIMVKESEADKYLPADSEKCKPAAHTVKVCDAKTGNIITVNESEASTYEAVDSDACKETPTTPATELPKTGSADVFGSVLALGSLTAATYYYVTSRRN